MTAVLEDGVMIKYNEALRKQVEYFASEISRRTQLSMVEARYITKIFYDCSKSFFEDHGHVVLPKLGKISVEEVYDKCFWRYSRFTNTSVKKENGKYAVRDNSVKRKKR